MFAVYISAPIIGEGVGVESVYMFGGEGKGVLHATHTANAEQLGNKSMHGAENGNVTQ
jgi:hypothetical protein